MMTKLLFVPDRTTTCKLEAHRDFPYIFLQHFSISISILFLDFSVHCASTCPEQASIQLQPLDN